MLLVYQTPIAYYQAQSIDTELFLSSVSLGTLHLPVQTDFQYCVKMPRNDLSVSVSDMSPVHVAQWLVQCVLE